MKIKEFLGSSYTLQTPNYDSQETLNWYPQLDELGTGKDQEVLALIQRPGYTLLHTFPRSPIRAIHQTMNGYIYIVAGNGVYNLTTSNGTTWSHTLIATLTTSTGRAYIQDGVPNVVNGQVNTARVVQVVVVDGTTTGLCFQENTTKITLLTSGNGYLGSSFVAFQDGFFLFSQPNTPVCQFAADPLNISGTDTIIDNLGGDNITRVLSDHDILWLVGNKTCSVWQNTGGVGFFTPNNLFQQIPGSFSMSGAFPHTICAIGGQLLWLQTDANGYGQVFQATGFRGLRISNTSQELFIKQQGDLTNSTAWSYENNGHTFYCLNMPNSQYTLCYDIITKMWHKRAYYNGVSFSRDLGEVHYNVNLPNTGQFSISGDYASGNIYIVDENNYSDNGQPIYKMRITPPISAGYKRMFFNRMQIDVEGGVGLSANGFPYVQGTTGNPILQTATKNLLLGNGPAYSFSGNDGSIVTANGTPTIYSSGTWSDFYTVSGNTVTMNPAALPVPLSQFALGDGETTSFNINNNTGTGITNALIYASDWRGNNLQLTTPRTNLIQYATNFNKGWITAGSSAIPSPLVNTGSTASSVTTFNIPQPNSTSYNAANNTTTQAGWNMLYYTSSLTSRPTSFVYDTSGTYTIHGTGIPTGSSTTITTASATNYINGANSGTIYGNSGNNATTAVGVYNGSSLIFSGFNNGNNTTASVSGTLYISIGTVTSTVISGNGALASGEIDVQYMADAMKDWQTILSGTGGNDLVSTTPLAINITVQNLSTLKVRIMQTAQPYYTNVTTVWAAGTSVSFNDTFNVYDVAFVGATSYSLNAPDGSSTGTAIVEDSSNGYHGLSDQYTATIGQYTTYSIYAIPGDATRQLQLQLGTGSNLVASAIFNLQSGTIVGSVSGNNASYNIQGFTQTVPSTGVILVNTLVASLTTGITAQIAPSVLQTPTNGNIITYLWSFVSGSGATITTSPTFPTITLNVGNAGSLLLQCIITVNGVPTIYTQFITVVAATTIYRYSITGQELITGYNTAYANMINIAYPLQYNNPPTTWTTIIAGDGHYGPQYGTEPWNTFGPLNYQTVAPSVAQANSTLYATIAYPNAGYTYAWSISNPAGGASLLTSSSIISVKFNPGNVGTCTITCKVGGIATLTSSQTITVLPKMQAYYPGTGGSAWIGVWGAQVESYGVATLPTPLIETIGNTLTDVVTLNAATGNILFGVAPLEDAVLTASFTINAISVGAVEFSWSGTYYEALPNIIYLATNPQLSLSYSIDGGHTYSTPVSKSLGAIGNYLTRCIWWMLGQSIQRCFKIVCTDPVKCNLIGSDFDVHVGNN